MTEITGGYSYQRKHFKSTIGDLTNPQTAKIIAKHNQRYQKYDAQNRIQFARTLLDPNSNPAKVFYPLTEILTDPITINKRAELRPYIKAINKYFSRITTQLANSFIQAGLIINQDCAQTFLEHYYNYDTFDDFTNFNNDTIPENLEGIYQKLLEINNSDRYISSFDNYFETCQNDLLDYLVKQHQIWCYYTCTYQFGTSQTFILPICYSRLFISNLNYKINITPSKNINFYLTNNELQQYQDKLTKDNSFKIPFTAKDNNADLSDFYNDINDYECDKGHLPKVVPSSGYRNKLGVDSDQMTILNKVAFTLTNNQIICHLAQLRQYYEQNVKPADLQRTYLALLCQLSDINYNDDLKQEPLWQRFNPAENYLLNCELQLEPVKPKISLYQPAKRNKPFTKLKQNKFSRQLIALNQDVKSPVNADLIKYNSTIRLDSNFTEVALANINERDTKPTIFQSSENFNAIRPDAIIYQNEYIYCFHSFDFKHFWEYDQDDIRNFKFYYYTYVVYDQNDFATQKKNIKQILKDQITKLVKLRPLPIVDYQFESYHFNGQQLTFAIPIIEQNQLEQFFDENTANDSSTQYNEYHFTNGLKQNNFKCYIKDITFDINNPYDQDNLINYKNYGMLILNENTIPIFKFDLDKINYNNRQFLNFNYHQELLQKESKLEPEKRVYTNYLKNI